MHENHGILQEELNNEIIPDKSFQKEMIAMGFHPEMIKMALKNSTNLMDDAVEFLLKMQADGSYEEKLCKLLENVPGFSGDSSNNNGPSTSKIINDMKKEKEVNYRKFYSILSLTLHK